MSLRKGVSTLLCYKRVLAPFLLLFFFICINCAYAEGVFKPFIVESEDKEVCELALNHYTELYKSKSDRTKGKGLDSSLNVVKPNFVVRKTSDIQGVIKTAEADFYGSKKLFVYYGRLRVIRDVHTGYIINPDQIGALENQLKENKKEGFLPFYPMDSLSSYRAGISSWENLPFQYKNKWYILNDLGDFHSDDSQRNVYLIQEDGSSRNVCTIKIFQNFDTSKSGEKFPFFSAYKKAVEEIMVSPVSVISVCWVRSYYPEIGARRHGRFFASMAIIRPWAIEPTWESRRAGKWGIQGLQQKHFDDWQFQDIWSYREHAAYQNLMSDAITELKNHYIANYSYSENNALEHASGIIHAMPGRYYSLGQYPDQGKDFSFFQRMVEGTYENWANLKQDLKLEYDLSVPPVTLSLMIDTPQQYKKLPQDISLDSIKSFYNKDILMFAAHMNNFDSVKYLIDSGWPVDSVTNYEPDNRCDYNMERLNRSALTYAAENGSIELIKLLVDAGSDTTIKDSKGNTLDYYIELNPRFSVEEKESGFEGILKKYANLTESKPGFSCKEKLNRIEGAICSSKGLSIYDHELNKNYRNALKNRDIATDLESSQIKWIKSRNKECSRFPDGDNLNACLARTTRARIRYLEYVQSVFNK